MCNIYWCMLCEGAQLLPLAESFDLVWFCGLCTFYFLFIYIFFGMSQQPIDKPRLRIFIIQKHSWSRTSEASFQVLYMWSWTRNELWNLKLKFCPFCPILPIFEALCYNGAKESILNRVQWYSNIFDWNHLSFIIIIILRLLNLKHIILDDDQLIFLHNLIGYLKACLNSLTCSYRSYSHAFSQSSLEAWQ